MWKCTVLPEDRLWVHCSFSDLTHDEFHPGRRVCSKKTLGSTWIKMHQDDWCEIPSRVRSCRFLRCHRLASSPLPPKLNDCRSCDRRAQDCSIWIWSAIACHRNSWHTIGNTFWWCTGSRVRTSLPSGAHVKQTRTKRHRHRAPFWSCRWILAFNCT